MFQFKLNLANFIQLKNGLIKHLSNSKVRSSKLSLNPITPGGKALFARWFFTSACQVPSEARQLDELPEHKALHAAVAGRLAGSLRRVRCMDGLVGVQDLEALRVLKALKC